MKEFKLCYVKGPFAFFTTADLKDQLGDDWDDVPYEHNADEPYVYDERGKCSEYEIMKLAYEGDLVEPCEGCCNSSWSVEDINAKKIAWLRSPSWSKSGIAIHAGTTIDAFIKIIEGDGGNIYLLNEEQYPKKIDTGEENEHN